MARDLGVIVAALRDKLGSDETECLCMQHGANSRPGTNGHALTLAEAIDLAEGDGLNCDWCGSEIVAVGEPLTDEVLEKATGIKKGTPEWDAMFHQEPTS